ncbi:DAHL domain-containing protein, partial [Kaarinaea lacus]
MKPAHLKAILIASSLIVVSGILFLNSKSTNLQQFRQEIQLLRDVRLINALINQELLTIRYQLYTNFDALADHISKLKSKYQTLEALSKTNQQSIKVEELNSLIRYLNRKFSLTDEFKTANALLKNSLTIFPNLNEDLLAKLNSYEHTELIANHVDSLLRDIYLFSLTND